MSMFFAMFATKVGKFLSALDELLTKKLMAFAETPVKVR